MSIYDNNTNLEIVKTLKQGEIFIFRDIIRKAYKSPRFDYRYDKDFISSLKPNKTYEEPYIYSYNINDTLLDRGSYIRELEQLIQIANGEIALSRKYYKDYRFDILGSWTDGKIIVMRKVNLTEKELKNISKKSKKEVKKLYKREYRNTKNTIKSIFGLD